MSLMVSGCVLAGFFLSSSPTNEFAREFYPDPAVMTVEHDGQVVRRLECERIPLDYPELSGRGEVNAAVSANGDIWAAVGYMVGAGSRPAAGLERLFHSRDGGKTWTSRIIPMTKDRNVVAFTVLKDDTMLVATDLKDHDGLQVYCSADRGVNWELAATIKPDPFRSICEGFVSLTQLADDRVLLPVKRWTSPAPGLILDDPVGLHSVYVSDDGGKTWPVAHSVSPDCAEAHIIQLKSGQLLGAFRYQRPRKWDDTNESLKDLGAEVAESGIVFKHVFLADSHDGGKSWTSLRPLRDKKGQALLKFGECHGQLVQLPDERIVLVHGNRYPGEKGEVRARISEDGGQTWSPEIYHVSFGRGYASSVALPDGTVVTITGNVILVPKPPAYPWPAQAIRWRPPGR